MFFKTLYFSFSVLVNAVIPRSFQLGSVSNRQVVENNTRLFEAVSRGGGIGSEILVLCPRDNFHYP